MALPDTVIERRELPHSRSAPTDTGVAFIVILSDRGPTNPTLENNLSSLVADYGPKQVWSGAYDGADVFFRERGYALYVMRAVGPGATFSTVNLAGASGTSLVATDKVGPGASLVTLDVITNTSDPVLVPTAGHFRIRVSYKGGIIEDSGDLATRADAVAWAANSKFVGLALGADATNPVAVAGATPVGGVDDHANVGTTQIKAALDKFVADLGPGQVAVPGFTSDAIHDLIVDHAFKNNRTYMLDLPDTANDATLRASATHIRSLGRVAGSDRGGIFAPWDKAPGDGGTVRTVPPSWRQMATMARNDASGLSPNVPAAGDNGVAEFVNDLSQPAFTPAVRQALNEAGVNVSIIKYGNVTTYGYRTPVDQSNGAEAKYGLLSNQRLEMAIKAEFKVVEDRFQFKELDGFRRNINRFGGQLSAVLLRFHGLGSLHGEAPSDAYRVDVGPTVNTEATMAAEELRAECVVRMSPFNERTIIGIARVPSQEVI